MNDCLVSIVMPVYKTEEFLDACVQSVLGQNYPSIELLLVDDGSPDRCPELCDQYAAKYPQITAIHQKNQGLGMARNAGIAAAHGKYVFFIDSDDLMDGKDAIGILVKAAEEKRADITVGNYRKFNETETLDVNRHHLRDGEYVRTGGFRFDGFYRYGHLAYNWGKLYRREFLTENDLFCRAYPFTQDKAHNMLCYACNPVYAFVDDSVYLYRLNEASVTFRYKENLMPVWISIARDFHETLDQRGIREDHHDLTDFHIFFGSFFLVKQELQAGKGVFRAASIMKQYGKDPFVKQAMCDLAKGKYKENISSRPWRFVIRCASMLFAAHGYLFYTLGIALLRGFGVDGKITEKRNRRKSGETTAVTLSQEVEGLCLLLRHALKKEKLGDTERQWLRQIRMDEMLELADSHKVLPLLYDILMTDDLEGVEDGQTGGWQDRLKEGTGNTVLQSYRLLFLTKELTEALKERGIPVIVLKGVGIASWYPEPEYRKSGDVDLLLESQEAAEEAVRLLSERGYGVKTEQHANHHVACEGPEGIDVELHTMLAEPFDDEGINKIMEGLQADCFRRRTRRDAMGVSFPVAPDDLQALELLLHMLQHFLRAGFGLKLLTDWVVFWNGEHPEGTSESFLTLAENCGLTGFAKAVTLVCESYLGLERGKLYPTETWTEFPKDYAADFLMDIIKAEEFGKADPTRMVALRQRSFVNYVKEFHYQMRMNYPEQSRKKWMWPVLWIRTLRVFLTNNRRLKRGSLRGILKSAGDRARVVEKMRLFQRT